MKTILLVALMAFSAPAFAGDMNFIATVLKKTAQDTVPMSYKYCYITIDEVASTVTVGTIMNSRVANIESAMIPQVKSWINSAANGASQPVSPQSTLYYAFRQASATVLGNPIGLISTNGNGAFFMNTSPATRELKRFADQYCP